MALNLAPYSPATLDDVVRYVNYYGGADVTDDPAVTTGRHIRRDYSIGAIVQERMKALSATGGVLWSPADLDTIPGFGQDKLRDVVHTIDGADTGLLGLLAPVISQQNAAEVFTDGPDCLQLLLVEIGQAAHFINMQMCLFFSDDAGWAVADALADRAANGVAVRVMADAGTTASGYYAGSAAVDSATKADFPAIAQHLRNAGAEVIDTDQESYWEWQWPRKRRQLAASGVPEPFLAMHDLVQHAVQANWNVVDHRKFLVIDGQTALIASLNVGGNYLYPGLGADGLPLERTQWHDGMLRIRGPFADGLNSLFASTWLVRGGSLFDHTEHHRQPQLTYGSDDCALMASFPGGPVNPIREYLLMLAPNAQGRVIIENPYVNDPGFYNGLAKLDPAQATRVSFINPYTSDANDYPIQTEAIRCRMRGAAELGVRLYDFSGGTRMSHWKISADDALGIVCHGSYNLNFRSAMHDFEVCAIVRSRRLADDVIGRLDQDIGRSAEITDPSEFYLHPAQHAGCAKLALVEKFA